MKQNPKAEWEGLLAPFAPVFTRPTFGLFVRMASAWVLCLGRRTLTRIYQIAEPRQEKAHDAYHRFFREAAWSLPCLWEILSKNLVATFYPAGVIPTDLDDTLFHKTGRRILGAAWWRDAVRSTGQKVVHALGLNLVVLTLRVVPPWGGEPLALPINLRLHRKNGPGLMELAEEMIHQVAGWFPQRSFHLHADGFFAPLASRRPAHWHLTSRMRRDAALFTTPSPRRPGQRGRTRKRGQRLPTPECMACTKMGWRQVRTQERGKQRARLILARKVLWYKVLPDQPVLLLICRDPKGKEKDDFFFSTDLEATPSSVVGGYAGRWSIEDTFRASKQHLGGEHPQSWKSLGPERAAAFAFSTYSLVWAWYLKTQGARRSWIPLPWFQAKCSPSFVDALAALRRVLWRDRIFSTSEIKPVQPKIVSALLDVLAMAG